MIILGIGDSHEAHACVVKNGELLAVVAEERLSRLKSDMGYPKQAIEAVLDIANISASDIDYIAFAGTTGYWFPVLYKIIAKFSVSDYVRQCHEYWKPILLEGKNLSPFDDFELFKNKNPDIESDPYFSFIERAKNTPVSKWDELAHDIRCDVVSEHLGLRRDQVLVLRHEDCHKVYGVFSAPFDVENGLVLTIEGGGDDSSATVSTYENDKIQETWKSNSFMVGRLYRYVTLLLGMKPTQHEYKVMGLAPYGNSYLGEKSLKFFRKVNSVSGTEITRSAEVKDMYFSVKDALEGERFDGVAWGIQSWVEELLTEWVDNLLKFYGGKDLILSGGVAQNIKALKAISDMDCVKRLWVGPISGDGSLGIGAAWIAHRQKAPEIKIKGLPSVYLGSEYSKKDIEHCIHSKNCEQRYQVLRDVDKDRIAQWLADGLVVARFAGRMEFGQRALGNRSILADPRRFESVEKINRKVKFRDFWMPFTPSIIEEDVESIVVNPKNLFSPFMTMAFDVRDEYREKLPAVLHPADKTIRPQMLKREANPKYYDLLVEFKKKTGIGVLLNTSFNLHGEPIVESPYDAVSTFDRCDLDVLILEDTALVRSKS